MCIGRSLKRVLLIFYVICRRFWHVKQQSSYTLLNCILEIDINCFRCFEPVPTGNLKVTKLKRILFTCYSTNPDEYPTDGSALECFELAHTGPVTVASELHSVYPLFC